MINILKITEITEEDEFKNLKKTWNKFLKVNKINNIFFTWEWISTWWKHFKSNHKLCIIIIEDNNDIVLIAPFMKSRNLLPYLNKIEFIGYPDSDYNGLLVSTNSNHYVPHLLKYIKKEYKKSHIIFLKDVPENNEYINYLDQNNHQSFNIKHKHVSKCPYMILPHTYEEFYNGLKKKFKKNLKYRENKLNKIGEINYKTQDNFKSIEESMEKLYYLNRKRFKHIGTVGHFELDKRRKFHTELANLFKKESWLKLGFLTLDNEPISAEYSFKYNNKIYAYQSGFDPEYSKYSVGRLCEFYHIKNMIEEGINVYDWTRGFEEYIRDYTTLYQNNVDLVYFGSKNALSIYQKKIQMSNFIKKTSSIIPFNIRSYIKNAGIRI